jgi:hypothetical protein
MVKMAKCENKDICVSMYLYIHPILNFLNKFENWRILSSLHSCWCTTYIPARNSIVKLDVIFKKRNHVWMSWQAMHEFLRSESKKNMKKWNIYTYVGMCTYTVCTVCISVYVSHKGNEIRFSPETTNVLMCMIVFPREWIHVDESLLEWLINKVHIKAYTYLWNN